MIKLLVSHVASVYLLVWTTLVAQIDPGSGSQLRNQVGHQGERQSLVHDPLRRESNYLQLGTEDYQRILTQKTMELLSEAVAMLNHVRDVKSKRWLDNFVFKIGQLALKISNSGESIDKVSDVHPSNQFRNKDHKKKNTEGRAASQNQDMKKEFKHEDIRSDANDHNYYYELNSDKSWVNASPTQIIPKRFQKSLTPERNMQPNQGNDHSSYSHTLNLKNQTPLNPPLYSAHQLNHAHDKQTSKQKEHLSSPSMNALPYESHDKSLQSNKNISFSELFSPLHHSKVHRRGHGKENSHKSLHYRNDDALLHAMPDTSMKAETRQTKRRLSIFPFAGADNHRGTKNDTSNQNNTQKKAPGRSRVHHPFMPYHYNHNHHHRSHPTNKIRSNNPSKKESHHHYLATEDKFRKIEEQLQAGRVLILSDSVVRSNFAKPSKGHKKT